MPVLSLCMIVRDEQDMLPGFLGSVQGLWDELIAVDTGSRDATVAILRKAGARVASHAWSQDFAAARNASLAAAAGDWVLYLDADERATPALIRQIRALVADERAGAATLVMRNEWPDGQAREADLLRLFRNDPSIRFRHRIHEDPSRSVRAYLARTGLCLRRLDATALHLGYVRETAAARDKRQRDLALLQAVLAEDPEDFYAWFKLLEAARFWGDRETWGRAAADAAQRLPAGAACGLPDEPWSGELAALIAQGLHGGAAEGLAWLQAHAHLVRATPAWHLRRGMWLEETGSRAEAARAYEACLADPQLPGGALADLRPLLGLCRLAAAAQDLERARGLARQAAALGPRDPEALLAAAGLLAGQELAEFLRDHAAAHPEAREPLARALVLAGRPQPASALLAADDDPASLGSLGLLVCSLALDRDVELRIDAPPAAAAEALKSWISLLWRSRSAPHIAAFRRNSSAVADHFPWLPAFLAELEGGGRG